MSKSTTRKKKQIEKIFKEEQKKGERLEILRELKRHQLEKGSMGDIKGSANLSRPKKKHD